MTINVYMKYIISFLFLITLSNHSQACMSDISCGFGKKCIKASGSISLQGTCVTPVDEYGIRKYDYNISSQPTSVEGCSFTIDCPISFKCVKKNYSLKGLCIK